VVRPRAAPPNGRHRRRPVKDCSGFHVLVTSSGVSREFCNLERGTRSILSVNPTQTTL
jgi:hypothetical protein